MADMVGYIYVYGYTLITVLEAYRKNTKCWDIFSPSGYPVLIGGFNGATLANYNSYRSHRPDV